MSSDNEKFIRWTANEKVAKASQEASLLDLLIRGKAPIQHTCGGYGTCGTCRVMVDQAHLLSPRNEIEQEMAQDRGFIETERLACQVIAQEVIDHKLVVKIPISNL